MLLYFLLFSTTLLLQVWRECLQNYKIIIQLLELTSKTLKLSFPSVLYLVSSCDFYFYGSLSLSLVAALLSLLSPVFCYLCYLYAGWLAGWCWFLRAPPTAPSRESRRGSLFSVPWDVLSFSSKHPWPQPPCSHRPSSKGGCASAHANNCWLMLMVLLLMVVLQVNKTP